MKEKFLVKLEAIYKRYCELSVRLSEPEVISDTALWAKTAKDQSELAEPAQKYAEYAENLKQMNDAAEAAESEADAEMKELLLNEVDDCREKLAALKEEIKILLLPKDKNDDRNCIMEIRGGAGGEEAALFAYELYRMYLNYCEHHRLKVEVVVMNETELGGIKEIVFNVCGRDAYKQLKFESGVHRVQRVPETESQGRVHTSTATVAVLPEAEDVEVEIKDEDIRVDVYRSSGAGGQKVNKTETAIRITHFPTGIVVTCQDEKSQIKNRETAMKILKSRLYDHYEREITSKYAEKRKSQVGTGDRSERIRTYNFPQGRVTDHRIGYTMYALESFLDGDMFEMLDALSMADQTKKLSMLSGD